MPSVLCAIRIFVLSSLSSFYLVLGHLLEDLLEELLEDLLELLLLDFAEDLLEELLLLQFCVLSEQFS